MNGSTIGSLEVWRCFLIWVVGFLLPEIAVRKFMPCHLVSLMPRLLINENEQLLTLYCCQCVMI